MFKTLIGDLFESKAQTLVNTVNCVGVMGKGVALEFKKRFPAMFEDYAARCERKEVRLGLPYLYDDLLGTRVVNFPTKDHWRSPSRLRDIEQGLDYFVAHMAEWGITSVAMPPLGCGNGGLDWSEVGPLIYRKLHALPIDIELYAPYGTPKHELSLEFLSEPAQLGLEGRGRQPEKLNPAWVVPLEVLRELGKQRYASPVGRTIFQKICYVLTVMGVPTGFRFGKGSYGPFAEEVKLALHELANRNWLMEQPLGPMMALKVGPQYEVDRAKFREQIERYRPKIEKTVDLFSRIKNTEQAEEVMTVLFASRQLRDSNPTQDPADSEILDFVVDWKKSWRSDEKKQAVAEAIRNLVMLGWMRVRWSATLEAAT